MNTFWALNVSNVPATTAIVSNAIVATMLAVGVTLLGRFWKNPAALHVLWLVVLLKLFTPPLVTTKIPPARLGASLRMRSAEKRSVENLVH